MQFSTKLIQRNIPQFEEIDLYLSIPRMVSDTFSFLLYSPSFSRLVLVLLETFFSQNIEVVLLIAHLILLQERRDYSPLKLIDPFFLNNYKPRFPLNLSSLNSALWQRTCHFFRPHGNHARESSSMRIFFPFHFLLSRGNTKIKFSFFLELLHVFFGKNKPAQFSLTSSSS